MDNNSTHPAQPAQEPAPAASVVGPAFWHFILLQFQTVFSDIVFKFLLIAVIMARYQERREAAGIWLSGLIALCALPYLLFSGWAGTFADRVRRRTVLLAVKTLEFVVMALTGAAFYFLGGSEAPLADWAFYSSILALFLLSTLLAAQSPSKHAMLPELLPPRRLVWGGGIMEGVTCLAVGLGIFAGAQLYDGLGGVNLWKASVFLMILSLAGIGAAWSLAPMPAPQPALKARLNFLPQLGANLRLIVKDRILLLTAAGISYYWALGALVVANAPFWGEHALGLAIDRHTPGLFIAPVVIGVGIGAVLAGFFSKRRIELGFIPLGGLAIALCAFPLGMSMADFKVGGEPILAPIPLLALMISFLILMGAAAGFYHLPLKAWLDQRLPRDNRGGVLGALSAVNFIAVLLGMAFYFILKKAFHFSPSNIFALTSVITFGVTIFLVTLLPEVLLGMITTVVTRFLYRIKLLGGRNIPSTGPALLVSNHVSMLDALLISAVSPRPVRFIVWKEIFDSPILGFFLRIMKAIPVSSDQRPRALIASLSNAADALNNGELVCIFAEGQVTRAGLMLPFRRGFKHILARAPVPVIPIYLEGVWGGIFSYERGKFVWRWPTRIPNRVRIAVGKALPSDVSAHDMRQSVLELSADCAFAKKDVMRPVHHRFLRQARKRWRDFSVCDSITHKPLPYWRVAMGGMILARRMKKIWGDQEMVGIFLPPSVGGVISNVSVALAGKVAVNLNYTTGPDILRHCIEECKIKTILTSKLFLARLGMEAPPGSIFLDDLMKQKPKITEILGGILAFHFFPLRLIETYCGAKTHPNMDSLMTVIFSSGSTGMPKGVMLTHFNIASNLESVEQAVSLWHDDRLIGFLPFFHSFGYTAAVWGSLCLGFSAVHHANPLEAKAIGDLVERYKITIMIATPTFLQNYIRRVEPEKFATLEFILTGAEKLPARIAEAFEERFGVQVHEGYGTTECAPIVSANVDEYRSRGFHHNGSKRGTIGHPVPGVVVRICNVDTGEPLPGGETGMIQVRGANIMKGYLNKPEKTAEVIKPGGYYETGDLGFIDDEGFIHITDRLARFSKIGGEMVPHVRIEEELHDAIGSTEQTFAVTSVPDEAKGERLVVLYTADPEALAGISDKLAAQGLPNLWIPRTTMYFKVDQIPVLGTGKLDLAEVRRTAARMVNGATVGVES